MLAAAGYHRFRERITQLRSTFILLLSAHSLNRIYTSPDVLTPILLTRASVDPLLWDSFIERSQQRVIYAYSWYLDVVCDDWNALVWPSVTDFKIVMPIPLMKKWGFAVVRQPFFCQYLGLFTLSELTVGQGVAFLSYCDQYFSFISSYHFHPGNYSILAGLGIQFPSVKFERSQTHWLSLNRSIECIRDGYSGDRRRNLKRSLSPNWQVTKSTDLNPMISLFRRNHAWKMDNGVSERAYDILQKLFLKLLEKDCAELWYAWQGSTCHAGTLFARDGETAIYLFNAADAPGRKRNARTHLLDNYFGNHADRPGIFDFESPEVRTISAFYESFGAEEVNFMKIQKNDLPFPLKHIQWFRRWLVAPKTS